jgi:ubiquinone/menaquinone biosynthesis C-methylase UbiE
MEKVEYRNMYNAEDTHFYYVSLHKTILSLFKRYTPSVKKRAILDAGCGTGRLAQLLEQFGTVTGIDMSDEALKFAKKRGLNVQKASVTEIPFPAKRFDVVISIDVIVSKGVEDEKALKEFHRVLKPGGILILRVSAIPWLKLSHDRFVHSNKRYNKEMLKEKLIKAGFQIEKLSYMNSLLAPVGIAQHVYEKFLPPVKDASSVREVNRFINQTATGIMNAEGKLLHSVNLPFGLGIIAVGKKESYTQPHGSHQIITNS